MSEPSDVPADVPAGDLARPVSARVRERLRRAGQRFNANDNIADYLEPGEYEALLGEVETEVTEQAVHGGFRTAPGSRNVVGVTAAAGGPLYLPPPREVDARLDRTVEWWRRRSARVRVPGPWADDVARGVLLLMLLPGRAAPVRDTAAAVRVSARLGLREETQAALGRLLDDLAPVADQLPPRVVGDVLDAVLVCADRGQVLDAGTGRLLAGLADRACEAWRDPDAGPEHPTSSALGCWLALRRAVALARTGQLPGEPARWAAGAAHVAGWVHEHCWSPTRGAFVRHPGTDELDTAVLRHAGGFDAGPRMSSTIDAVLAELGVGPLLRRRTGARAAAVAPSFRAVSALRAVGRTDQAGALLDRLVPLANDVGVFAERIDPADGAFLGTLPHAASHVALVEAALDLAAAPA